MADSRNETEGETQREVFTSKLEIFFLKQFFNQIEN